MLQINEYNYGNDNGYGWKYSLDEDVLFVHGIQEQKLVMVQGVQFVSPETITGGLFCDFVELANDGVSGYFIVDIER
jgi:hypothetical protein